MNITSRWLGGSHSWRKQPMKLRIAREFLAVASLLACSTTAVFAQISNFSSGYVTPENINLAPAAFGANGGPSGPFSGKYFINDVEKDDPLQTKIFLMPGNGGIPTVFASNLNGLPIGALFLPSSGWGSNSGRYLTVGESDFFGTTGQIFTYDANANRSTFYTAPSSFYAQAVIAPSTFGANAGKLIVTDEFNGVFALDSSANVTIITDGNGINPFGAAFAPKGFGQNSGSLFIDDELGNTIKAIDANGGITTFAQAEVKPGQVGLRQLTFSPSGFFQGINQPLLFVSIAGSLDDSVLGDIQVYDLNGSEIASLHPNQSLAKFNPRGLFFTGAGNLLVSDISDPILSVSPSAFSSPVPEPGAVGLLFAGSIFSGLIWLRRLRRGKAKSALNT